MLCLLCFLSVWLPILPPLICTFLELRVWLSGEDSPHRQSQCPGQSEERGGGVPPSDPQLPASLAPTAQAKLHVGWFEILPSSSFLACRPSLLPLWCPWSWESEIGQTWWSSFSAFPGRCSKNKEGSKEKSKSARYHIEKPSKQSQSFALLLVLERLLASLPLPGKDDPTSNLARGSEKREKEVGRTKGRQIPKLGRKKREKPKPRAKKEQENRKKKCYSKKERGRK